MRNLLTAALLATALPLGGCAMTAQDEARLEGAGTGAAIGAVGGAGASAILGGDPIAGAAIGAAIGGLAGAVWADANGDGRVDGYTRGGEYYAGTPAGYDPATGRACTNVLGAAATGAGLGAVGGAGVGAVVGGVSPLEGAIAGAVVGGIAGAVWADANNDGCVDGYTRGGEYYPGVPQQQPVYQAPVRRGERG